MPQFTMDAALGFVTSQTAHIEREALRAPLPAIRYAQDIPVDTSPNAYASSVTFFTQDAVGRAKYINGHGDDIPLANIRRGAHEVGIDTAGIGYMFSIIEIGQAQMMGINLPSEGAMAARTAFEQFVDEVAYIGNAEAGTTGLFNNGEVEEIAATVAWDTATPDQILADVNGALVAAYTQTNGLQMPNTLRMPIEAYAILSTRKMSDYDNTTILTHIRANNLYTATTGQPLDVLGTTRLTDKLVAYQKAPDVLKMYMPQPLTFIAPQPRNLEIYVPGWFRFSPVNIRKPSAVKYVTGILA